MEIDIEMSQCSWMFPSRRWSGRQWRRELRRGNCSHEEEKDKNKKVTSREGDRGEKTEFTAMPTLGMREDGGAAMCLSAPHSSYNVHLVLVPT